MLHIKKNKIQNINILHHVGNIIIGIKINS